MIVEVDLYYQIRTLYNEGESIRSIARRLNISRPTVKKYCEGNTHPDVRKPYMRDSEVITDEIREFIKTCLDEDRQMQLPKQRHTAKRIYDRLVTEKGFKGGESTIRNEVKALRIEVVKLSVQNSTKTVCFLIDTKSPLCYNDITKTI